MQSLFIPKRYTKETFFVCFVFCFNYNSFVITQEILSWFSIFVFINFHQMDTSESVQFTLTSYVKIMHICKSVLKYYNFIFYSFHPLAPSKTGFCSYNHTMIHYMTMHGGRWRALCWEKWWLTAEPNQGASQSDRKKAFLLYYIHFAYWSG